MMQKSFLQFVNLIFKVGFAVEKMSKRLEVNDQKTKVRRIEILPEHDETGKRSPSLLFCKTTSTRRSRCYWCCCCYTRSPMILMKFLSQILFCAKIQFSTIVYPPAHSRTVLAVNLPMERPTIESVAEIFSVCGEVALIRILRPGKK